MHGITLHHADALALYEQLPEPVVIISDGPYGLGLFPGDPHDVDELIAWYAPHVKAWSERATPQTTLWFWNSELGWATVHTLLVDNGWTFVNCHIWDKGISHAAGNSNTKTLRKFPIVTEVCVQYVKQATIGGMALRDWLRSEWARTGLPFSLTNDASGTKNAATRKYFTKDHLWYFPPPAAFAGVAAYANENGDPAGRPYFSLDGQRAITPEEWAKMRAKFVCKHGVTNVWKAPALNGAERIRLGTKSIHLNQKPLKLMELIIDASSDPGDLVWEPFGGLCTGALAAHRLGRRCVSVEVNRDFFELAVRRLRVAE